MNLLLKGEYTVKKNGQLICSKNHIQDDGFSLVRNWFVSQKGQIKLIDQTNLTVESYNINSDSLSNVSDVFLKGNIDDFAYIKDQEAYFKINLEDSDQQVVAIGVDIVHKTLNGQNYNANLLISYNTDISGEGDNWVGLQQQPISVAYCTNSEARRTRQLVYYFDRPLTTNKIRIDFNTFCNQKIQYEIYSINLYTKNTKIYPPQRITLYGKDNENNEIVIKSKYIETKFSYIDRNSIVYKVNLQFGELDSTNDMVYAISTDYYDQNDKVYKKFSYSSFDQPWQQQELQIIQLQYQLSFGDGNSSQVSDLSDS